jgi:Tol biopolymer transport system component
MLRLPRLVALACLLAVLALASPATAQRAMTLVDLLSVPDLTDPQLAPTGSQVAYVLAEADWKANRAIPHVWRVGSDGTGPVQLTNGKEGETSPRWAPDGRWIAFLSRRGDGETTQIHLISNEGGEAFALTTHPTPVSRIAWAPDGSTIYFAAADAKSEEEKSKETLKDDVYAYDEDFEQVHLWAVSVADKKTRRITEGGFSVIGYELSRDGKRIAHHRAPTPLFGDAERGEVWVMSADGSAAVQLTRNGVTENGASLSPDGAWVMFGAQANARFETYYNRKIFVVPSAGGEARVLTAELPYEVEGAAWAASGSSIYFVANMGVHSEIFEIPARGGAARQLTDGQHAVGGWTFDARTNRHVFQLDQPDNPGDVWTLAAAAGAAPQRVTRVFESLKRDFKLPACASRGSCSTRPTTRRGAGTRWSCRRTAGRRRPTSSGSGGRRTRCRCSRPWATPCSSPITEAAPATATRSCATWWAATSRTRTSTSWRAWTT